MYQRSEKNGNAITYVYRVASLDKKEMLGYIRDILIDDDFKNLIMIVSRLSSA